MSNRKLFTIHGLGGHSGWFDRLKDELLNFDIDLYAYDLPGFGLNHVVQDKSSIYQKGHIDSYKEWKDFVRIKYVKLKEEFGQVDVLGHSLGAVLASSIDFDKNDKLILSVPGYKGAQDTFNPIFVSKVLWHYAFDKKLMNKNVFLEMPVSDKDQDTPALRDELRVASVSQNLLFEILELGKVAKQKLPRIQNEVLMLQVEGDRVVDNQAQDECFELIGSENKTKKVFSGTDHDWIWTDKNAEIARFIADWLKAPVK
jgi:alpha-beta hydrolase superfamily lysophospholipase